MPGCILVGSLPALLLEFCVLVRGVYQRPPLVRLWVDASRDEVPADDVEVVLLPRTRVASVEWRGQLRIPPRTHVPDEVWFRLRMVADPGLSWLMEAHCTSTGPRMLLHRAEGVVTRRKTTVCASCELP